MVFILLATEDAESGAQLRESLGAQGWWVTVVGDREGALRAAADQEPEVVIIDGMASGAADLVKIFSSRNGGPGALVLGPPERDHENLTLVEAGADEFLSSSPPTEELVRAVERVAAIPHQSSGPSPLPVGRQLTAEEIFGDILSEVDGAADTSLADPPVEPAPEVPENTTEDPVEAEFGQHASPGESAFDVDFELPLEQRDLAPESPSAAGVEKNVDELSAESPSAAETTPPSSLPLGSSGVEVSASKAKPAASRGRLDSSPVDSMDSDFGQYRLEERIAVGGMAEVWRASMVGMEGFRKTVAIKKILPHLAENEEFVAMFVDEAKLAAQLSHENLVDIYDLGKIDGDFFIAMEYVEGRDLRSILNRLRQRREPMALGIAFFIAARISAALDYAHTRLDADGSPIGLVHRDVSPRNILISHNGNVRLCDFGVAKAVSSVARTEIGALKGKIQYMSPEQAAGARVDARSDIFSLGSVLFEMVTGRRLFVEDTEITLLDAVRRGVTDEPRSVRSDLPEEVNSILLRALSKDPESRYQTAGELQRELDEALFRFEPKPTQGALAEWLGRILEKTEEPEEPAATQVASEIGTESVVSRQAMPDKELPADQDECRAEPFESDVDEATAETKVLHPPDHGRRKFWFGVAAGLLLAVLLAFALEFWLGRRARSEPPAARTIDAVAEPEVPAADEVRVLDPNELEPGEPDPDSATSDQ